jgi:FkbM family methyltransferase
VIRVTRLHLLFHAVIDCAYLVRSRLGPGRKVRLLVEYLRLTVKAIVAWNSSNPGSERILGYTVRHFGVRSVQFLFSEIFVRNEYLFAATVDRPLVFDCGANIGMATLYFKWLYPRAEVHAFEPDPDTFQALKANVERNGLSDVHLHNVALAGQPGHLDLFVPAGPGGSPLMSTIPGRMAESNLRRIVVDASALSTYVGDREIDFLKMDVEGAEESVMGELAATATLRNVKEMAVEYHHNLEGRASGCGGLLQLLVGSGYQYQLDATWGGGALDGFQDILIRARRSTRVFANRESCGAKMEIAS